MLALIRWRVALAQGGAIDLTRAKCFAWMSDLEAGLREIVIAASGMARGVWAS